MEPFDRPTAFERLFNKLFGVVVGFGLYCSPRIQTVRR